MSRDQMEDRLFSAGIRNPRILKSLMRDIDKFAVSVAHRMIPANEHNEQFLADPYYYLGPGEWDTDAGKTRCDSCFKVRAWSPYFHVDPDHPSGHLLRCKACLRRERESNPPLPVTAGWMCPVPPSGCGSRRTPGEFPQEKRDNPRRPIQCLFCSGDLTP
jgi:hypothetical protein